MKILTAKQIQQADKHTIENEPIASIDLMERASMNVFSWLTMEFWDESFQVFCGIGNNGGDGLAVARMLAEDGANVEVYIARFSENCSPNFLENEKRLQKLNVVIKDIKSEKDVPKIKPKAVVIDALFGSGLSRPIEGFTGELVQAINKASNTVIAIDIPSGLFGEDNTENNHKHIVQATHTLTFEVLKLALLFPENEKYVGNWHMLPIGLSEDFINSVSTPHYFVDAPTAQQLLLPRQKFAHKGTFGNALLLCGSYGKVGAAVLAAQACLRSGAGLTTVYAPKCGYTILQSTTPEAMVITDEEEKHITACPDISSYNAIGVGPGLGTHNETANAIKQLIQNSAVPIVFDADAINILAENKTWLSFLPANCIFTPHPKEFERLVGKADSDYQRLTQQKEFAAKYNAIVVLKGAHTCITTPDGEAFFNSTGNSGMATGGTGDVLTGIITGLIAQGYTPKKAAVFGVYLHGLAGDIAAKKNTQPAMVAGDVTKNLKRAYKEISKKDFSFL